MMILLSQTGFEDGPHSEQKLFFDAEYELGGLTELRRVKSLDGETVRWEQKTHYPREGEDKWTPVLDKHVESLERQYKEGDYSSLQFSA